MTGPSERWEGLRGMLQEAGVRVEVEEFLRRGIAWRTDLRAVARIRGYMQKHDFDLVHTHSSKGGVVGRWAAWSVRRKGRPVIVHTPHGHVFYGYFGPVKSRLYREIERVTARITDALIALTESGAVEYRRWGIRPRRRLASIPSGVDFGDLRIPAKEEIETIRSRHGGGPGRRVVGTVARLVPVKGVELLVRAAALLRDPSVVVWIIGDGPLRAKLESLSSELGMGDAIKFLGWQTPAEPYMAAMDVFVQPSLNEGMGRTLVMAEYMERICVAPAVGGIPSLIRDGETGYLVATPTPEALSEGIRAGLNAAAGSSAMGRRAKEWVAIRFSQNEMCRQMESLYASVLEAGV